jgi:hypothetical protein
MSTMRLPQSVAMRGCAASGAGMAAAPGSVSPIASQASIIVAPCPAVMQVPKDRAMPPSMLLHCSA